MATEQKPQTEFIVMTSSAKMPTSCWGRYGNVAVLEVLRGQRPRMISDRCKCVVRIVSYTGKLHSGGPRSAFQKELRAAEAYAAELNAPIDFSQPAEQVSA